MNSPNRHSGQALILVSVFIAVILGFTLIITGNVLTTRLAGTRLNSQLLAQNLAEAGIQKAIWCLNLNANLGCGSSYGVNYIGETGVNLDTGSFSSTVSGSGNERTILSTGTTNGTTRVIKVVAKATPNTSQLNLNFATQVGDGGLDMDNNASVIGGVYSNGPITCDAGATVTGNATSACSTDEDECDDDSDSKIAGCTIGSDAKARTIQSSTITKDAYFQIINNSTVLGTQFPSSPVPTPQPLPISSQQIQLMKDDAAAGGTINGDFNPSGGTVSLGPIKITGNLTLDNNEILTVTGTIWVQGNVTIDNNATIRLSPSYGANTGVILSDGWMHFSNNGTLMGSGNQTSFIMFLSLAPGGSHHGSAIDLHNNAAGAIFYAANGLINLHNGVTAQELTAKSIHLDNNAVITYSSGLATTLYSSGSGGTWSIKRGTWVIL